jgi:hypothetical protein
MTQGEYLVLAELGVNPGEEGGLFVMLGHSSFSLVKSCQPHKPAYQMCYTGGDI